MRAVGPPMLAGAGELPRGADWAYELKWDGIRALAVVEGPSVRWYARSGSDVTGAYPELAGLGAALQALGVTDAVLDGEIVVLDSDGRPSFPAIAERMHVREAARAARGARELPATYMIFDVLRANGTDLTEVGYEHRRQWLESIGAQLAEAAAGPFVVPPRFSDGAATLAAAAELGLEGVVAKRLSSLYRPGVRSTDWVKVKREQTLDVVVGGWRAGARELGALLVGAPTGDGRLRFLGRVGGGISAAAQRDLLARLRELAAPESPFDAPLPRLDSAGAVYVRPELVVEVRYGNVTPDGRLRFPRFVRARPDKSAADASDATEVTGAEHG